MHCRLGQVRDWVRVRVRVRVLLLVAGRCFPGSTNCRHHRHTRLTRWGLQVTPVRLLDIVLVGTLYPLLFPGLWLCC